MAAANGLPQDCGGLTSFVDRFICGDAGEVLRCLPDSSVDMFLSSPPYYQQRDYDAQGQIGNEATPEAYIDALLAVFAEAQRVLKDTGTLWLNLGDKYVDGRLLGMPWRVALAFQDRSGWILRSDIIWHKPNAMPSSVSNRPTTDHEYLFFFAKTSSYHYDADAIREPHVTFSENSKMRGGRSHFGKRNGTPEKGKNQGNGNLHDARWDQAFHPLGRNRRTVWNIPLSKFPEAHFAVFPDELAEICINAGSPRSGIVVDPFMGSGTTALVARRLGRQFIGIDISPKYCEMAQKRLDGCQLMLPMG